MAKTRYSGNRRAGTSSITAAALTVLEAQENRTYKQKTEQALIVDDNGNVLLKKRGGRGSVKFTYQETQLMNDHIVTHNHPSENSTFSVEDVNTLTHTGMKAMRATCVAGTYMLERQDAAKDMAFSRDYSMAARPLISAGRKKANDTYNDYRAGKVSYDYYSDLVDDINDQTRKVTDQWLRQNASKYGYTYTFERRK